MIDDLVIARHEIGHAVVAVVEGRHFSGVTIVPSSVGPGCIWGLSTISARVHVAGVVAERIHAGAWSAEILSHGEVDLSRVRPRELQNAIDRATAILTSRWSQVQWLARMLVRRRTLPWSAVAAIVLDPEES